MQFIIGIVPPETYLYKVQNFQRQWQNNHLVKVVEPHITVKAQGGLTTDKKWLRKIEEVCKQTSPFTVCLERPEFFGNQVLFLSVNSPEIYKLHQRLVQAISPSNDLIQRYMEMERYHPHLTLGQTYWGLTPEELKEMEKDAKERLTPYPEFTVNFLRIYQEIKENKYQLYRDVALS
ncbi:2'-5' RNA ligase [Bacillus pseudomycoides]|uniref:2'-5' RNA ligase family protein n=1 Tax=Bacillus pseudomycoides TaxID=64104 RepID=UPI000BF49304|nr:2'-5' RNA ligase family protein [Bacillus pseudomycoides]PGA91065.1 2'-5' RNA ligase [Bacillus pseudomycoides]